jgi:hypothetical protein
MTAPVSAPATVPAVKPSCATARPGEAIERASEIAAIFRARILVSPTSLSWLIGRHLIAKLETLAIEA